ncbi:CCA tRNA nucleotidyltransferase [Candidatus Cyanaurora vandensis]|uniref:CCA tRNA nucleotidyltransferase n=1 Tax=Candidatus Cyanaurora vandensis TaxID=2714958 RepID=UPI0025798615|nr:HD domain-containing protein [Candidatus Cyanaurora vandensis]
MLLSYAQDLTNFLESHRTGAQVVAVGGYVRDSAITEIHGSQAPLKDLDLEIYRFPTEGLRTALQDFARQRRLNFLEVGKSFGVFKLSLPDQPGLALDVAVPRRESQQGPRHQDFAVVGDPEMSFPEAAARRDFTINSMGLHLGTKEWFDPYQGRAHLDQRLLKHVSSAFAEDALRVLRGAQFMARFNLRMAPETEQLCRTLTPEFLSRERIEEEFNKLLTKALYPSLGLEMLRRVGWLAYFPELAALVGVPQDPQWHPEGNVWVHTCMVVDQAARLTHTAPPEVRQRVMYGALCHDLGKPPTTQFEDGHWRSRGHDVAGEQPSRNLLKRITENRDLTEAVVRLVLNHLHPHMLWHQQAGPSAVRRLANRLAPYTTIQELVLCARADHFGRTTPEALSYQDPGGEWLLAQAEHLAVHNQPLQPLLMGRHLIERSLSPSPQFKLILAQALEAQIEGKFQDLAGALDWLDHCYGKL